MNEDRNIEKPEEEGINCEYLDSTTEFHNHDTKQHRDSDNLKARFNQAEKPKSNTTKYEEEEIKLNFQIFASYSIHLFKKNSEFLQTSIFFGVWLFISLLELVYGLYNSQVNIISDSFFNFFKSITFLISSMTVLFRKVLTNEKNLLINRLELLSSLANCVFLFIVSTYMILESMHLVTENHSHMHKSEEATLISFLKNFFSLKIIIDSVVLIVFSDYLVHPSIQLKLQLWKKYRYWIDLKALKFEDLAEMKPLLKKWNNHYENMNSLCINVFSDLVTNIIFVVLFHFSNNKHFENIYFLVCIVNLLVVIFLSTPLFNSIFHIFLQGKSVVHQSFYEKIRKEASYFEGVLSIKDLKCWMVAQNELKCNFKVFAEKNFNKLAFQAAIQDIANEIDLKLDLIVDSIY